MKRKYCLYLDEGGDFDQDLKTDWKNECLVGGYLVEKNRMPDHTETRKIIADAYRMVYPQAAEMNDQEAFTAISHATDIKDEKKADICYYVLTKMSKKVEFVIFENYNKTEIVSSVRTYLNILVDGIIQLFTKLIVQNCEDTICLEVLAGFRKNTSGEKDILVNGSDIAVEEYEKRINERLMLERVKRSTIFSPKHQIIFKCGRDKTDHFLVPCDYICNFYITRTAKAFREECRDGMSYRECLLKLFEDDYIFHLNGSAEQDRLLYYMDSQTFDAALFDICTGVINTDSIRRSVLDNVKLLKEKQVHNILSGLSVYLNDIIEIQRNTESALEYLEKAEEIIKELSDRNYTLDRYRLDIKLYKLAVYDHLGDLNKMQELFEECQSAINRIIARAENIEYVFMFLNRYAVYLFDIFEFEKGYNFLEKLKKCFEAYELMFVDLPGIEVSENTIRSTQLGKILGTQAQYCRYFMRQKKMKYEDAVKISNQAIENFELEADRERQYQYRAQIEAEAGKFDTAMDYLKRGWKVNKWDDIFREDKISPFALYHLSFLMERFAGNDSFEKETKRMVKKFRDNEDRIFSYKEFPGFLICANIAKTMVHLKMDDMIIRKYYKQALVRENDTETKPLFNIFMLMIHADYAGWLIDQGKNIQDEQKKMKKTEESILEKIQIKSIQSLCKHLSEIQESTDVKEYMGFGRLLQY